MNIYFPLFITCLLEVGAKYDGTITLGNIITGVSFIFSAITVAHKVSRAYAHMETKVAIMNSKLDTLYNWWIHKVDEVTVISTKTSIGHIKSEGD